ncbi:hypothetical protein [Pedobacter sp. ASV28]|uniref:hypothetical protein n=1 Tax=Pedobacter sp. ASV28 TaxID=2795123 RepID=UPI0018ECB9D5|nr:hypothetical protein [Pedobacter sp. ASV28]
MQSIRDMYVKAIESKKSTEQLLNILEKKEQTPFVIGYTGATKMLMARHTFNPFKKLSHFRTGKQLLEKAISKDAENVELIFLRYAIQVSLPPILGYNEHIETDKNYILKTLQKQELKEKHLEIAIVNFLKKQQLAPAERQQLLKQYN